MRPEFAFHKLNETGVRRANDIAEHFERLMLFLELVVAPGRELAIVKTKLEEASFFAKKGMAMMKENQAK